MSNERGNSHTNPEIGRSLERARAERGLSLWQVEEATKIRARYLHDLERENFDVLPAVYVLGSLKTYADFLGLDGEALARELKSRQEPPPEERDPTPEEPNQSERGGFLAALGGLPLIGDRDAVGDDRGAAPAAVLGYGSGLYLVLGAVSILVLAIALTTILFWGGDQPAVSHVREPAIPEAPSRIAFSGNAEDSKDDERNQNAESKDDRSGEQAESSDGGDEKGKKEDEKDQVEKSDRDDTQPEDTGNVAGALPASISAASTASASTASASTASASTASASTASASASATAPATSTPAATAPATSTPAATAPASAPSAATVPAASAAPQTAEPVARAPAGPRRVGAADGTRPVKRIVGKVRIVRIFSR